MPEAICAEGAGRTCNDGQASTEPGAFLKAIVRADVLYLEVFDFFCGAWRWVGVGGGGGGEGGGEGGGVWGVVLSCV